MKWIGYAVIAVGAFLFAGNVFGFFRTFPAAGWITIMLGTFLVSRKQRQ